MKPLAARTQRISGKGAFGVWEKAMALEAQGKAIIHFELGEPDFATPAHIIAAAEESMRADRTHYASGAGEPTLRAAIAAYLQRSRGVSVDPAAVLVTPGVKGTLYFALLALIDHSDEVLIPAPFFPPYAQVIRLAGGVPVECPLPEAAGYQLDPDEVAQYITPRSKALIICSPGNPTGTIFSPASLAGIAALAQQHDLWVLSDEVYHQLYYTPTPPPSIYALPGMAERTVLMDGFSKAYAMTGWRLGFGVFPEILRDPVIKMMVADHSCIPPFIQDAGAVALNGSQECVETMRLAYKHRRDRAMPILDTMPQVRYTIPAGAFYFLLNIAQTGLDSETLAYRLLEAGVALLPAGPDHLRLAYTRPEEEIVGGLAWMGAVISNL